MAEEIHKVKIQVRRGVESELTDLSTGEPALSTDTTKFFVGTGNGNKSQLAKQSQVDTIQQDVTNAKTNITSLQTDNGKNKQDITQLKTDTSGLRTDLNDVIDDVGTLGTTVETNKTDINTLKGTKTEVETARNGATSLDERLKGMEKADNRQSWKVTAATQTRFTLTNGSYTVGSNSFAVYIEGVLQPTDAYVQVDSKNFDMVDPVPKDVTVTAIWREGKAPIQFGHNTTHYVGGQDPLDVTKLANYQVEVADKIGGLQTGVGANTTQLASISKKVEGIVNVKDFGAKGDWNGTTGTDDSPFIQAAVNYLFSTYGTGGRLYFPPGKYRIVTPINIYKGANFDYAGVTASDNSYSVRLGAVVHIQVEGQSMDNTFLINDNADCVFKPQVTNGVSVYYNMSMRNIRMVGKAQTGTAIQIINEGLKPWHFHFEKVAFNSFEYGFKYDRRSGTGVINGYANFTQCYFGDNNYGALIGGDNTFFTDCYIENNKGYGLIVDSGWQIQYNGGKIQYNGRDLLQDQILIRDASYEVSFNGVYLEPRSSAGPNFPLNAGVPVVVFENENSVGTIGTINFNYCYLNANKAMYFADIKAGLTIESLNINQPEFRNFKVDSDKKLIRLDSTSIIKNFSALQGRITNSMNSTEVVITDWCWTNKDGSEGFESKIPITSPEQRTNGGTPMLISGASNSAGTQRYFGRGYTVTKESTGLYRITLGKANQGTIGGNSAYFPVTATATNTGTDVVTAMVENVSSTEFKVHLRKADGTYIDKSFSFMVEIVAI